MTNIMDVARTCGVSIATVSRAFNKNSVIKADTRIKILETAEAMGYTPNMVARGLKRSKSQTVGIIIPSIDNYFYIDALKYIEIELQKRGYRLIVSFIYHGVTEEREALEAMSSARLEALIIFPRTRINEDYIKKLSMQSKIIQLFTAPYDEYDSLVIDDVYGIESAVRYLIDRGHRRILYIGGDSRVKGYKNVFDERGIQYNPALISLEWLLDEQKISELIKSTEPTAVIAVARQAEAVWCALNHMKTAIPDDISFIANDDVNWVKMFGITSVSHPLEEIALRLIERLFFIISNESEPQKITIRPFITERTSVKSI